MKVKYDIIVRSILSSYFKCYSSSRLAEFVSPLNPEKYVDFWRITETIFLEPQALVEPALLLRRNGPKHLSQISIGKLISELRAFVSSIYWIIEPEFRMMNDFVSVGEVIKIDTFQLVVEKFKISRVVAPKTIEVVYPIAPMRVDDDFHSDYFSIVGASESYNEKYFIDSINNNDQVQSWVCVRSESIESANRIKRIILGACALSIIKRERNSFTLRKVPSNFIVDGVQVNSSLPHTPPIGSDILIRGVDHNWLSTVSTRIGNVDQDSKSRNKALEYYNRAWFLDENERCVILFMSLEAIFGKGKERVAVKWKNGIEKTLDKNINSDRLEALLLIRNQIVHGGAPDVYASSKYIDYYQAFLVDPIYDLELLVAKCMRLHLFGADYVPQNDPYAEIVKKHQSLMHLPREGRPAIVEEW